MWTIRRRAGVKFSKEDLWVGVKVERPPDYGYMTLDGHVHTRRTVLLHLGVLPGVQIWYRKEEEKEA